MKLIAQIQTSEQTSPDAWQSITRTLIVDETTTIAELLAWWFKVHPKATAVGPVTLISADNDALKEGK